MADKVKTVVRDSTGLIVQTIESDSDNPLVPRVRDLEKALAIQLEHDRLLEARYMDFTASLMRETREQRETITALRRTLRAAGAELRTVVGIADRRSREADHLRRALRSSEAAYDQASSEARSLRESDARRRRTKTPYWHRIGKLVGS